MIGDTKIEQYGPHSRQVIKTFPLQLPASVASSIATPIVFIHGGAWRDPANTCEDFSSFAYLIDTVLDADGEGGIETVYIFSVDYRLSPEVRHPQHLLDLLDALAYIRRTYGITEVALCGHSVGATLITQTLEQAQLLESYSVAFAHSPLPAVTRAIYLDGIYDVTAMLKQYPEYASFVENAFNGEEYTTASCNSISGTAANGISPKTLLAVYHGVDHTVVHSTSDELLTLDQPRRFVSWLPVKPAKVIYDDFGHHNDVFENPKVARIVLDAVRL